VDSADSGQGLVTESCEHSSESLGSTNAGKCPCISERLSASLEEFCCLQINRKIVCKIRNCHGEGEITYTKTTLHSRGSNGADSVGGVADRLCGLVVRVLGYRSGGPGSIPGTTKKK
jgi:hypothetical protein